MILEFYVTVYLICVSFNNVKAVYIMIIDILPFLQAIRNVFIVIIDSALIM